MSSLEVEAMKRKERLIMLKRKIAATEGESNSTSETTNENFTDNHPKKPTFRSYNPGDESLKNEANVVPPAEPIDVQEQVQDQIASAKETAIANEIDLTTLAPRKIDWDLKRDAEKKLRKLERRTQWAIAELIRVYSPSGLILCTTKQAMLESVERNFLHDDAGNAGERLASGKEDLLLSAVNSGARAEEERHSSDDED